MNVGQFADIGAIPDVSEEEFRRQAMEEGLNGAQKVQSLMGTLLPRRQKARGGLMGALDID